MAKGTTSWKTYEAELEYAQVFTHNMDPGNDDTDAGQTVKEKGGQYKVTMIVDDSTKDQMVSDGIPEISLGYNMFHPVEGKEGFYRYVAKRPHLSPFKDEETGELQEFGPPNVVDWNKTLEAGEAVKWDDQELIGNGSTGKVKISIYKNGNKRIVRFESLAVMEHVPYTKDGGVKW